MKTLWIGLAGVIAVGAAVYLLSRDDTQVAAPHAASGEMVAVTLPDLSGDALVGQRAFAVKCAACHGPNAGGVDGAGPPLIHKIYEPGHHGDIAFYYAAARGVTAHHWTFGDMPAVQGITEAEVASIVAFVRQVQVANGIQ